MEPPKLGGRYYSAVVLPWRKNFNGNFEHDKSRKDVVLATAPSAAPLKFFAESIDFVLHPCSSPQQLADLVPVGVPQVTIGQC